MVHPDAAFFRAEFLSPQRWRQLAAFAPPPPHPAASRLIDRIRAYMRYTTLHGMRYVVGDCDVPPLGRCFFGAAVLLALATAGPYIGQLYGQWSERPIIISHSPHPVHISHIPMPAITVCSMNRVQRAAAVAVTPHTVDDFLLRTVCGQPIPGDYNYSTTLADFQRFLRSSALSCAKMVRWCTFELAAVDCADLFRSTVTDDGLCCTFNAVHPRYLVHEQL